MENVGSSQNESSNEDVICTVTFKIQNPEMQLPIVRREPPKGTTYESTDDVSLFYIINRASSQLIDPNVTEMPYPDSTAPKKIKRAPN